MKEIGTKEDPWFPGDGLGIKIKLGPAATAAPPGARPGKNNDSRLRNFNRSHKHFKMKL